MFQIALGIDKQGMSKLLADITNDIVYAKTAIEELKAERIKQVLLYTEDKKDLEQQVHDLIKRIDDLPGLIGEAEKAEAEYRRKQSDVKRQGSTSFSSFMIAATSVGLGLLLQIPTGILF